MAKLLLLTGDFAAGKSTFAGILSRRYQTNVFSKDTIKEVLGETIGFSNREENLKLSCSTMALMVFLFSEFAKLKKDLILEANFHERDYDKLFTIAKENGYEVLTLVLRGDISLLHKRYLNRMTKENRNPVHLTTTMDVFEDFQRFTEALRKETIPGESLLINVDDFSYQTDEKVLAGIDRFMK